MAIKSFPYSSSIDHDRKITASDEAKRLNLIAGSGVIFDNASSFECELDSGMNVNVAAGSALVAGHAIISDDIETVSLDANNSTFSRVDLIVLESDENTNVREGHIRIIKGIADGNQNEPALNTTTGIVQIRLAKILIPAQSINLSLATLTDVRLAPVGKHTHTHAQLPVVVSNMYQNGFINGDFQVWQMGTTIVPSLANKWYTADMWKCRRNTYVNGVSVSQVTTFDPTLSSSALRVKRDTGDTQTNDFRLAYVFTPEESKKYIGKKITVSFSMLRGLGAAGTYTCKVIGAYNITGDVLDEFGEGRGFISQNFIPTTYSSIFTFTSASVITSDIKQLGFFLKYTPSTPIAGANDYFEITNCNWSATDFYVPFSPKSFADELQDCMTYYEKSYNQNIYFGNGGNLGMETATALPSGAMGKNVRFKVPKVKTPAIVTYGVNTGGSNKAWDATASTEVSVGGYTIGESSYYVWCYAPAGHEVLWQWVADARI